LVEDGAHDALRWINSGWTSASHQDARTAAVSPKPLLVDHIFAGSPVEKMITDYDRADINRAAEESAKGKAIKPVIRMPR